MVFGASRCARLDGAVSCLCQALVASDTALRCGFPIPPRDGARGSPTSVPAKRRRGLPPRPACGSSCRTRPPGARRTAVVDLALTIRLRQRTSVVPRRKRAQAAMRITQAAVVTLLVGFGIVGTSAAQTAGPVSNSDAAGEAGDHAEPLSGERGLGERCSKDCQCASRECKGFKCVVRDYSAHPALPNGKDCRFDGDCASCDCAAFKCR